MNIEQYKLSFKLTTSANTFHKMLLPIKIIPGKTRWYVRSLYGLLSTAGITNVHCPTLATPALYTTATGKCDLIATGRFSTGTGVSGVGYDQIMSYPLDPALAHNPMFEFYLTTKDYTQTVGMSGGSFVEVTIGIMTEVD